jgi:outer membrane protein TolC
MKRRLGILAAWLWVAAAARAAEPWTLEHALDYALAHNPDARIAQQRIAAAQAGLDEANSAYWPHLQVQSSYTRTDNPMMVFGNILAQHAYNYASPPNFNDLPDVDDANVQGIVTVPLYAGGRISAGKDAAKAGAAAARQEAAAVRNELGFEVARAFYTVLKTRDFIRAAEAEVHSYETNLTIAQARLEGGTLLKSDVLDIEVRLAQSRENLVRARNANQLAGRALRNLLGIENGDFTVADSAPKMHAPEMEDISHRPELAAARERERAAKAQLRGAKSGYLPRVSAFGSLGYNYGWVMDGNGHNYTAGVMAQWDLWDGFSTRSQARKAEAGLESTVEQNRKLRLAIDFEYQQARLALDTANERLAVTEKSVAQAQESVTLTQNRFEQGLALSTQLIDAETALVAARVGRAEATADQRIAIAALRKALALPQLDSAATSK